MMTAETQRRFTVYEVGVFVDGARGLHSGQRAIELAKTWGFILPVVPWLQKGLLSEQECYQSYWGVVRDATDYLNSLCADGVRFGWDGDSLLLVESGADNAVSFLPFETNFEDHR